VGKGTGGGKKLENINCYTGKKGGRVKHDRDVLIKKTKVRRRQLGGDPTARKG